MNFTTEITTDALPSLLSYCKDLMRVVEIPFSAVKAKLHLSPLPKTFQCLPHDLGMKSRVCARLKGYRAHLCRYNLFLSQLHARLHCFDPSKARDPMGFYSSQSLSAASFSAPPFTLVWAGAPPKCSLPQPPVLSQGSISQQH